MTTQLTKKSIRWMRRIAVIALALAVPNAAMVPMAYASDVHACKDLLAADHLQVLERLRVEVEAMSDLLPATLLALKRHDELRQSSELGLSCFGDERNPQRDRLWAIHWSYFHVVNSLQNFAFRVQETRNLPREIAFLLSHVAYAERNFKEVDRERSP